MVIRQFICEVCRKAYTDIESAMSCEATPIYEGHVDYHGSVFVDESKSKGYQTKEFIFLYTERDNISSVGSKHERLYSDIIVPYIYLEQYIAGRKMSLISSTILQQNFSRSASIIDEFVGESMYRSIDDDLLWELNGAYRSREIADVESWKTLGDGTVL